MSALAKFKGDVIGRVEHDRKADEFHLYDASDWLVATLSRVEYLSQPQLKALPHGRYRRAPAQVHRRPTRQPGHVTRGTIVPGATWYTVPSGFTFTLAGAPARPIEHAGVRAGEIIAHRGWRYDDGRLLSIYAKHHEWLPGVPSTGDVRHEYGVHAFKSVDLVKSYVIGTALSDVFSDDSLIYDALKMRWRQPAGPRPSLPTFIIGTVALWGEVVEHERGYRAEFAKVRSFDAVQHGAGEAVRALALLDDLCRRFGVISQDKPTPDDVSVPPWLTGAGGVRFIGSGNFFNGGIITDGGVT